MEDWKEIIQQVVNQWVDAKTAPIPGAALKPLIQEVASEDIPEPKFIDFLNNHSDVIDVVKQVGGEIVVLPKGRYDLLAENKELIKIRVDVFKAFTWILEYGVFSYNPKVDEFDLLNEEKAINSIGVIPVPKRTLSDEVQLRNNFADEQEGIHKTQLSSTLDGNGKVVLHKFTILIKSLGLVSKWHKYRSRDVLKRIGEWCTDKKVTWRNSWLSIEQNESAINRLDIDVTRNNFAAALSTLSKEDLARITVPLDIVQKLLEK